MDQEATKRNFHGQRGAALFLFVAGMFLTIAAIYAVKLLTPATRGARQVDVTDTNLLAIQNAIAAYVAVNGRLPCPANPVVADDGVSDPELPNAACNAPGGVVPWATLSISPDVVLDGWNRRISFRVFDGGTGLTQFNGASMVNCDTDVPPPVPPAVDPPLDAGSLCGLAHTNSDTQFLAGKGLAVNASGTLATGVAYVLISHGESGYGAYMPGGGRLLPLPATGDELTNTGASSPYISNSHSDPGVDPATAAHFDDVAAWATIPDLMRQSGRQARDWEL